MQPHPRIRFEFRKVCFYKADDLRSLDALPAIEPASPIALPARYKRLKGARIDPPFNRIVRPTEDLCNLANSVPFLLLDGIQNEHIAHLVLESPSLSGSRVEK